MLNYTASRHPLKLALADLEAQARRLGSLAEQADPDPELSRALRTTRLLTDYRALLLSSALQDAARREVAA